MVPFFSSSSFIPELSCGAARFLVRICVGAPTEIACVVCCNRAGVACLTYDRGRSTFTPPLLRRDLDCFFLSLGGGIRELAKSRVELDLRCRSVSFHGRNDRFDPS